MKEIQKKILSFRDEIDWKKVSQQRYILSNHAVRERISKLVLLIKCWPCYSLIYNFYKPSI